MTEGASKVGGLFALYRSPAFGRFLLIGAAALALHWSARLLLSLWMPFGQAVIVAYGLALAAGFELNRRFVFPPSGRQRRREVLWYVGVNLAMFPVVYLLARLLGEGVFSHLLARGQAEALGHGAAIAAPVFLNFALHKFFTFRPAGPARE